MERRFFCLLTCCVMIVDTYAEQLNVGVSVSTSAQREAFYTLAHDFESRYPNIQVKYTALGSEDYKRAFPKMLADDKRFDVLYWHAGQRLFNFIEKDLIEPIDDVWTKGDLAKAFGQKVTQNISYDGHSFAVPISYYQIGFYYSKDLFERLSLSEPKTWEAFIAVCEVLKAENVAPIFIGTKSNWPATAWFDYLNLRLHGIEFQQNLAKGKIAFTTKRIKATLKVLHDLKENQYFIEDHQFLEWRESLPLLSRGLVGMSLIGNYVIQEIRPSIQSKIGFFPFPEINENVAKYEEAPIDVLLIPKNADNTSLAKKFLAFASNYEVQSKLNNKLGVISPHRLSQTQSSQLTKEAYSALSEADGFSQFFDRDAEETFASEIMPIIDEFFIHGDSHATSLKLEQVRHKYFPPNSK